MDFLTNTKIKTYLLVKEGKNGIETYMDKDIQRFNPAYKGMLITFLKRVTKILEDDENGKTEPGNTNKFA
jgi:hypothetical protein